jgi:hypothetical protein
MLQKMCNMNVNTKMTPVESTPGFGGEDNEREW